MSQEEDLEFLSISHDLSERRDLILSRLIQLISSVSDWASLERISVDRVPVNKQILDRAVIMTQDSGQLIELANCQSIVREPTLCFR